MSRDGQGLDPDPEPREPAPQGTLEVTGAGALVAATLVGLVGGWAVRPVAVWLGLTAPRVLWTQVAVLYLVAAILACVAWFTFRDLQRGARGPRRGVQAGPPVREPPSLAPHQAVNRLVLGKACALSGAVVLGGYCGYALTWVGIEAELAGQRIGHSLAAAAGAALTVVAALLLERACRVRRDSSSR